MNVRPSILVLHARGRLRRKVLGGITDFYGMSLSYMVRDRSLPDVCRMPMGVRGRNLSATVLHGVKRPVNRGPTLNP